jgi:protoheme ferro-lyase
MTRIFWTSIEYIYNSEHNSNERLIGGFVYAFVSSTDQNEALNKFLSALRQQQKTAKEVDFIAPYPDNTEWENVEQTKHYKTLFEDAKKTDEVIFDTFYAYEKP